MSSSYSMPVKGVGAVRYFRDPISRDFTTRVKSVSVLCPDGKARVCTLDPQSYYYWQFSTFKANGSVVMGGKKVFGTITAEARTVKWLRPMTRKWQGDLTTQHIFHFTPDPTISELLAAA